MGQRHNHLSLEERCCLRGLMEMGLSISEIARRLGRDRGTVHREPVRSRNVDGCRPDSAERRAWARKLRGSKIERSTRLGEDVRDCLAMGWSPEQIAGRIDLERGEHAVSVGSLCRHVFSPAAGGTACRNTCAAQVQARAAQRLQ
jgi:IS30 family transposase